MNTDQQAIANRIRPINPPSDPLRDTDFINLLTRVYDVGAPLLYPLEAPGPGQDLAA